MKVELPEFKRCCCCIPLRYGLLAWGYIRVIINLLFLLMVSSNLLFFIAAFIFYGIPQFIIYIVGGVIVILLLLLDVSFSIVFLIGGHQKTVKLLRICYIYNIVFMCITTVIAVLFTTLELYTSITYYTRTKSNRYLSIAFIVQAEIVMLLLNFASQAYVILLIRSEINKLTNSCNFRFENLAAEAECTLENGSNEHEDGINKLENGNKSEKIIREHKTGTIEIDLIDETDNHTNEYDCESFNYRKITLN